MLAPTLDPPVPDAALTHGILTGCVEQRLVTCVLDAPALANSQKLPKLMLRGCDGQAA